MSEGPDEVMTELLWSESPEAPAFADVSDRVLAASAYAAFTEIVRRRASGSTSTEVVRVLVRGPQLRDSCDLPVAAWVIEALVRSALGEPDITAGIDPELLLDAQFGFVRSRAREWVQDEQARREITEAAEATAREILRA